MQSFKRCASHIRRKKKKERSPSKQTSAHTRTTCALAGQQGAPSIHTCLTCIQTKECLVPSDSVRLLHVLDNYPLTPYLDHIEMFGYLSTAYTSISRLDIQL